MSLFGGAGDRGKLDRIDDTTWELRTPVGYYNNSIEIQVTKDALMIDLERFPWDELEDIRKGLADEEALNEEFFGPQREKAAPPPKGQGG